MQIGQPESRGTEQVDLSWLHVTSRLQYVQNHYMASLACIQAKTAGMSTKKGRKKKFQEL